MLLLALASAFLPSHLENQFLTIMFGRIVAFRYLGSRLGTHDSSRLRTSTAKRGLAQQHAAARRTVAFAAAEAAAAQAASRRVKGNRERWQAQKGSQKRINSRENESMSGYRPMSNELLGTRRGSLIQMPIQYAVGAVTGKMSSKSNKYRGMSKRLR